MILRFLPFIPVTAVTMLMLVVIMIVVLMFISRLLGMMFFHELLLLNTGRSHNNLMGILILGQVAL